MKRMKGRGVLESCGRHFGTRMPIRAPSPHVARQQGLALGLLFGTLLGFGVSPSWALPIVAEHSAEPTLGLRRTTAPLDSAPLGLANPTPLSALAQDAATAKPGILADYGRVPMHFEPNQGQTAEEVRYLARGAGYSLFLTNAEAVLVLHKNAATGPDPHPDNADAGPVSRRTGLTTRLLPRSLDEAPADPPANSPVCNRAAEFSGQPESLAGRPDDLDLLGGRPAPTSESISQDAPAALTQPAVVRMRLLGATHNPAPAVAGLDRQPGISNYYLGNDQAKWRSGVPHFAKVQFDQVYPGIDLVFYGNPQQLEYDLVVAPGADPGQIRLSFEGVDGMRLDGEGNLVLAVADGEIVQRAPRIYQRVDGQERAVAGRYALLDGRTTGAAKANGDVARQDQSADKTVGLVLAAYDPAQPLVIDPVVVYSTYLGGSAVDMAYAIATDGAGNAYVSGTTGSADFPTANARYPSMRAAFNAFVTKLDAQGQGLVYSTYLGGSSSDPSGRPHYDNADGIVVDATGNAYVTGVTSSTDFPMVNARYPSFGGDYDAFVTKLDPQGQGPVYSTYLGGNGLDIGAEIAVDGAGNAYVVGNTQSSNFPTAAALYPTRPGGSDAFVTKFGPQGQGPFYSTYLGGSGDDWGSGIAVDTVGNAYVAGTTGSTVDFPITLTARYPNYLGGAYDAFVTKFDSQGLGLVYSTYLGGTGEDDGYGIAVDAAGNAFVTGVTWSSDFPAVNARYPTYRGNGDAFVTKLGPAGQGPAYSTYLGGSNEDYAGNIALDAAGNAFLTGGTSSGDFPTVNAINPSLGGSGQDIFVTKLDPQGLGPLYATYLGVGSSNFDSDIDVDAAGNAYVAGTTKSVDFPTVNALYPTYRGGGTDAFVIKIGTTYTVTPAAGTGGTVSPSAPQTVIAGATTSFLVTASSGFTRNAAVGGTCPQGSWSGDTWTTGAIGASCTVSFAFTGFCWECLPSRGGWRAILP
ncbi:SBBP repeat-containing protein [uncultured Lamprocystis sp.]|uniref:DUF7948 domain-containing protein n=2 Tax=uncultured Lamprocystis sp. TaxID=543132 RepID=UPI0025CDD712|nr:SBBP repeat-containing protein [uncultured Lamprocystis sp.]